MRLATTILLACLLMAGCGPKSEKNEFVGQWRVSVQCLDHESAPGHQRSDTPPVHLEGAYSISKRDSNFFLEPTSGAFKDEFSNCELKYNPSQGKVADGKDFSCDDFNPGSGAMNLSGTCDLTHSGRPTPHDVQVFLINNSPLYNGGRNPVIQFGHRGAAHAGWLH